jgi:GNAT superfamily N-acetyltransferase
MTIRVRPALLTDTDAIAAVHVAAWRAAYAGVMPAATLARLSPDERAGLWRTVLSRASGQETVLVADRGGPLEGFCAAGCGRRPDESGLGEIYALNVRPSAWGRGVGLELLVAAESWLRDRGFQEAVLWVARDNPRARRFYERQGWREDGGSDEATILDAEVTEVRCRRRLDG